MKNKNSLFNKIFDSFVWLGVLLLIVDIVTKVVVVAHFTGGWSHAANTSSPIVLIPGFLNIDYLTNPGAAFGMGFANPETNRISYLLIAGIASGLIIFYFIKKYDKLSKFLRAIMMLIVCGAIGNMIDRLFYSENFLKMTSGGEPVAYAVVDWIDFTGIWPFHFNIADSCIVIGCILAIVYLIVEEVKESKKKKPEEASSTEKIVSKSEKEREESKRK